MGLGPIGRKRKGAAWKPLLAKRGLELEAAAPECCHECPGCLPHAPPDEHHRYTDPRRIGQDLHDGRHAQLSLKRGDNRGKRSGSDSRTSLDLYPLSLLFN